jgi:hypothetical protein
MAVSLVVAIFYYDGQFYLPTCVRSLQGMLGMTEPLDIVAADDRAGLTEAVELRAVAGNATLTNAVFRETTDDILRAAMRLPNRGAFYAQSARWDLVEEDGAYALVPFKPGPFRGVVEDREHAVVLSPGGFVAEAVAYLVEQYR